MKIVLLNPYINAEHNVLKRLRSAGVAVLLPANTLEAIQMLKLHGASIDLAIIHREEKNDSAQDFGMQFISKAKEDPLQVDLPIILTTERWGDAECASHQKSSSGVNAYLKYPFTSEQLIQLIEAVVGLSLKIPSESSASTSKTSTGNFPILEDASELLSRREQQMPGAEETSASFVLEQPDFGAEESVPMAESGRSELSLVLDAPASIAPSSSSSEVEFSLPTAAEIELSNHPAEGSYQTSVTLPPVPSEDQGVLVQDELGEDSQAAQEMPYIYEKGPRKDRRDLGENSKFFDPSFLFAEPLGDAVVPGGAAHSPDLETFKKYLLLREQDVAVLSNQLKAAQDQIKMLDQALKVEKGKNVELSHVALDRQRKVDELEKEKSLKNSDLQSEMDDFRFQLKVKADRARILEGQLKESSEQMEGLKDRVRTDIRKIRVREKELENRLEIMKKDSEALIGARETKIIELKRKLDLLEFNMDLLQDQYSKEKDTSTQLRARLARAAQIVRVAGGLLDFQKKPEILEGSDDSEVSTTIDEQEAS